MSELQAILLGLGLQEYYKDLVEQGFNTWDDLLSIKETDMAILGIKLGHRRKLQREIAIRQGHDNNAALPAVPAAPSQTNEQGRGVEGNTQDLRIKRRYRYKAPRDPHAPIRPDTAYVAYSKAQRHNPEVAILTFVEIAKLVGDRWTHLSKDKKDIWNQKALVERDEYESTLIDYHQTEAYRKYCEKIEARLPRKNAGEERFIRSDATSQDHFPEPVSNMHTSKIDSGMNKSPLNFSEDIQQDGPKLEYGSSTAPASTAHTINSTEGSPSSHQNFPDLSYSTSKDAGSHVTVVESIWRIISQEQTSRLEHPSSQISQDELLSYSFQHLALSQSFHVQSIDPFDFQPRSQIRLIVESFLQNVNVIYYLIDPKELWMYLDLILHPSLEAPNLTLSVVCLCIAIGYQSHPTIRLDMAIMWYENGRRYLDDCDWNLDPTVMQILALISIFHMAQRPATSSHYLDAAIRIGEANNFHEAMVDVNLDSSSSIIKWLNVWSTIVNLNRILVLGSAANDSIMHTLPIPVDSYANRMSYFAPYEGLEGLDATQFRFIKAHSNVVTCAFGDLCNILGGIQHQLDRDSRSVAQTWEASIFMRELETWLQSLPAELLLPAIFESHCTDKELLENTINNTSTVRKIELLHLYSLYFGTLSFVICPLLQQMVTINSAQSTSSSKEDKENAYKCLNYAIRSIDLCAAFYNVSSFPVFAWLPQSILFNSSLICVLGILWQRKLLSGTTPTASQAWLDRSTHSLGEALHIFGCCGVYNQQCQRHYLVLQLVFVWLQKSKVSAPSDSNS